MSPDEALREQLLAASDAHHVDTDRIRARFDAGVATELRARRTVAYPAIRRRGGPAHELICRPRSPRTRLATSAMAMALTAAVVCGVTVAIKDVTHHGPDRGPAQFAGLPGPSSGPAAPTSSSPVPTPATSSAFVTPAAKNSAARPPGVRLPATPPRSVTPAVPAAQAAAVAPVPSAAPVIRCGAYDSLTAGSFMIDNNLWAAGRGTGTQCVRTTPGATTSIGWSSTWDWSGGPGQTKSFASAVLGWRWGYPPGPGAGLPVLLSDHHAIRTQWAYTLTQSRTGDVDVAYDVWLHSTPHPGNNQPPAAEMRVLVDEVPGGAAGSTSLGTFTVDGATWNLYAADIGWNVYSFVRSTPATGPVALDLTDFTDTLAQQGRLSPTLSVTSVQAGVDVIDGAGTLATSAYSVTID